MDCAELPAQSCEIGIVATDGTEFGDLVSAYPHLPASGQITVTPSRNTFTRYALTAQNPVGWDGRPRTVQLGEGSPSPSRIYYFKMLNPQSWSTTCLKTAHWSSDPAAAQRAVEQLYAGYSAAAIGASEYYAAGCS